MNREILRSKTFWTAVMALMGAVAGFATGEMTLPQAFQTAVVALIGMFLKDGQLNSQGGVHIEIKDADSSVAE